MSWISLLVEVPADAAEKLSEALLEQGALSVSVEDAAAGTDAEQPLFGEPGVPSEKLWERSTLRALCEADTDAAQLLAASCAECGLPVPAYHVESVEEEDWVRNTQAQFEPIQISPRLWIVPTWHETPDTQAINLRLDPGLAFGTGSHPTTRLCLRWLEENIHGGEAVLDYGCGSGILAIAAARLGAADVLGVDIDSTAVEQARLNAERNAVQARFMDTQSPLSFQADHVLANILAMPLKVLAPLLAAHCRAGGRIVLAGLLDSQDEGVTQAYRPWFDISVYARQEGWTALQGVRR